MEPSGFEELKTALLLNTDLMEVLDRVPALGIRDWYVGAGAIAQSYWNYAHGFPPMHEVKDIDLVYFDPDTSYEAEDAVIKAGADLFKDIATPVEIRNQARVHLWYGTRFGNKEIAPHVSTEDAIDRWPTTATSVGVRVDPGGVWVLYAPFGLGDLLNLIVRPNKVKITEIIYNQKVDRWKAVWPKLTVLPW